MELSVQQKGQETNGQVSKKRVQQYLDRLDLGELKLYGGLVVKFPVK